MLGEGNWCHIYLLSTKPVQTCSPMSHVSSSHRSSMEFFSHGWHSGVKLSESYSNAQWLVLHISRLRLGFLLILTITQQGGT